MTAPDLSAIRAQRAAITKLGEWETTRANDVVTYDPNGFGAYRLIAHTDSAEDAAFIAAAPSTVERLLGIVERVEALATYLETLTEGDRHYAGLIRTAITGEGGQ